MTLSLSGSEGQGSVVEAEILIFLFSVFLRQAIVDNEKEKQDKGVSRG
jgi:hypothetical protein